MNLIKKHQIQLLIQQKRFQRFSKSKKLILHNNKTEYSQDDLVTGE